MTKRKLIEVSLPLEAINRESAQEKSIRNGHPSTLHLWWSRKPTAAARAVLFAQLVDDPASHPEMFPTEQAQRAERDRLHGIIERLVKWENIRDYRLFADAALEIRKYSNGVPPVVLDPFAGGGSIPLEAQRLGVEAHASDLNPVAVLINKMLIEIPPRFRGGAPVFGSGGGQKLSEERAFWRGSDGFAADVRAYGKWLRDEAASRIGALYPPVSGPGGGETPVIAWLWARTVTCPNPACGIELPLVNTWWLGKRKGKEAFVQPSIIDDQAARGGRRVVFTIGHDPDRAPLKERDGTMVGRSGAICIACETAVSRDHIKAEGKCGRMGATLITVVADGGRKRLYLAPDAVQIDAAKVDRPADVPTSQMSTHPQYMGAPMYGMATFADLFTNRQLTALTTFSDLVSEVRERAHQDAIDSGLPDGLALEAGGNGARAYSDAIAVALGLVPSALANLSSTVSSWRVPAESARTTFSMQALPMAWVFVESNAIAKAEGVVERIASAIEYLPTQGHGHATQANAVDAVAASFVISTDPPYYDNVPYADISDFFYVWLRRSLRSVMPKLFGTMLVPKDEELVANHQRHNGREGAHRFFEDGFRAVFTNAREFATAQYPMTVYYAFKQSDTHDGGESSTGWESLLEGMIQSGWEITSTWPLRSEATNRMRSIGSNALASSIVLSLRPRPESAPTTDRRGFIAALEGELPTALRSLQQGMIAPVDLPQAAIGPGMAVFSRYKAVLEPDGSRMAVRSALARINEILDQVLSDQEGDYKPDTRFAITWYRLHGYESGKAGEAENVATARAVVLTDLSRSGILTHRGGIVQLIPPSDLTGDYDPATDHHISAWEVLQHLIQVLEHGGIAPAGDLLRAALDRPAADIDADEVKELAHLLFRIAEANGWTKDALSFNTLVTSWPEIVDVARQAPAPAANTQGAFSFLEED